MALKKRIDAADRGGFSVSQTGDIGGALFTDYTVPGGRQVRMFNKEIFDKAVERGNRTLKKIRDARPGS